MDINRYLLLAKCAETGNMTQAAEQLGYTQSAASHIFCAWERELGFPLLIRRSTGVGLTHGGEQILPLAAEIARCHSLVQQAAAEINGLKSGLVRVGTFTSVAILWLPEIISSFRAIYPGINIQIRDGNYEEVENWIATGAVDCGFVVKTERSDFDSYALRDDRLLAVLPAGSPLCRYERLPLSAFANVTFIVPEEGFHHQVGAILRQGELSSQTQFDMVSDYSAIAMVRGNMGVTVLPELVLQSASTDGVELRELEQYGQRTICLATPLVKQAAPATQRFVRHVRDWAQRLPKQP